MSTKEDAAERGGENIPEQARKKMVFSRRHYLTVLGTILLEQWPSRKIKPCNIKGLLEQNIFSMQLANARPAYDVYRDRFYNKQPQNSGVIPREYLINTLFTQRITHIWMQKTGWVPQSSEDSNSFSLGFIEVTKAADSAFREAFSGLWPEQPGSTTP